MNRRYLVSLFLWTIAGIVVAGLVACIPTGQIAP
jgi:hypothetical protein